jgi:hypothetical protein
MDRFFFKLNNFLIFVTVFFVAFIVLGFRSKASSEFDIFDRYFNQQATVSPSPTPTPIPGSSTSQEIGNRSGTVINKRVDVDLGTKSFEVLFSSDGQNGAAGGDQKDAFVDSKKPQIPVPLNFEVKESYAELPGELIYGAINKPNGDPNAICTESDATKNTRNDQDCLYHVTAASVFAEVSLSRYSGDAQTKLAVEKGISLGEAVAQLLNDALAPSSFTDQSRDTLGTLSFWASDELNQLTPIRVGSGTSGIQNVKVSVAKTAVNRDEGLFLSDFSAQLSPNTIKPLDDTVLNNSTGISTLNNPFIFRKNTATPTTPQNSSGDLAFIIQDAFKKVLGSSSTSTSKRLSAQVPLRAIRQSNENALGYNFCEATKKLESQGKWTRKPFEPNPFPKVYLPDPTEPSKDTGVEDPDSLHSRFDRLPLEKKLCLNDMKEYQGEEKAKNCAENYVKGSGCDEETIEEEDLMFEPIQQSLPFGLGAYFQNATLYDLNPDTEGPFINYLSPYYCSKLNISYNVTPGTDAPYVYKWSSGDGTITYTRRSSTPNVTEEKNLKFNNEYCVVGSLLSNFSWALTQQQNLFGSDNTGSINLPKEGLTCDKKESAYFGGSQVKANIQSPSGKLIYKNTDNKAEGIGRGFVNNEDVLINHGYDIYSLNDIVNEIGRPIQKYKDNDVKVVVDNGGKPKFVHLVEQPKSKTANRSSYLCRLRQNTNTEGADKLISQKNCLVIDSGNQLLLTGEVSYAQTNDKEYVTIVGYDRAGSLEENEKGELPDLPPPDIYYYVIEIKADISKSIVIKKKLSSFANTFETKQLSDGKIAVLMMNLFDGGHIGNLRYYIIDPLAQRVVFPFNGGTESRNLCQYATAYCNYIGEQNASSKLVLGDSGSLYGLVMGNGLGMAIPLNLQSLQQTNGSIPLNGIGVFSYATKSGSFNGDTDFISSAKFINGEFHIFMQNSGYYLKVISPSSLTSNSRIQEVYKQCTDANGAGSNNCLLTIQEEFNTKNFRSDCTNYAGTESAGCGYPKLSKLGQPNVYEFNYYGPDNIEAWYTYKGLDNTVLYSPDLRFSYTGVYGKLSDLEYSNVYVPAVINGKLTAKPIQYFNYGIGGITVGKHIQRDIDGNMTPIISVMKPDRYRCYQNFSKVTGVDPLFNQTGLTNVNLRSPNLTNSPGTTNPNTGLTGGNPGNSCEENWCIDDSIQLVNNPQFREDYKNEELKKRILNFFMTRSKNRGLTGNAKLAVEEDYTEKINLMCQKSSEAGIPCSFLAGIWIQESTANLDDSNPNNPPLGCFGESVFGDGWYKFPVQVDCAIGSMKSSLSKYNDPNQKTLSGYGSVFTPHNEEYDKNPGKFKGTCEPATLFSMVMQRYTPTDKRINFNNQCNNGLLLRDDQGNEIGGADCNFTTQRPNGSTEGPNRFDDGYTELKWPSGELIDSRMTLRITIENIDPRLAISHQCYKPDGSNTPDPNAGSKDIKAELAKYRKDSDVGSIRMNLAVWGEKSGAAANVKMIMHEKLNDTTKVNSTGGYGVYGIHEIAPGQTFSLNTILGNPGDGDVQALYPKYIQQGYTMDTAVVGGGWCELATTIRTAAARAKMDGSPIFKESTFENYTSNPDRVDEDTVYAPFINHSGQAGFDGDIKNFRHNSVTPSQYNKLVPVEDGVGIRDQREFVLMWSNPGHPDGFNDGDLEIVNPSKDKNLVIAVYYDDDARNMIRVDVFYGTKVK